ncbi:MAG TPA: phosphate/phosphite/phosphonate ABC transporter substrate-binding protein [Candidatus Binatia bacterium]
MKKNQRGFMDTVMQNRAVTFVVVVLIMFLCAQTSAQDRNASLPGLTLGVVAGTHQKEIETHFREFTTYLARKVSGPAANGGVIVAPTTTDLVQLLQEKKVDFYLESPYPTYVINDVNGAGTVLARRWKGGMAEYQSLIFTNRNSGITRLQDLRGKLVAFEDPESSSGYLLPKLFLQRQGLKLSDQSAGGATAAEETGYIFGQTDDKVIELVLTGRAAAGAFSDDDYARVPPEGKSEIVILAQTERLPRHLVSIRNDLPPEIAARLQSVLLSMHEDPEGRRILQQTDDTTKFDLLPGGEQAMRRRLLDTFFSPERR